MKNIILTTIGVLALLFVYAYNNPNVNFNENTKTGIKFQNDNWVNILKLAKSERKIIFLDIYASWCGPCKRLKKHTFSSETVGDFYNKNFINVSLDGEKAEGSILAKKYKITGYPSLLFISPNGEIIMATMGYHNERELINLGKDILGK